MIFFNEPKLGVVLSDSFLCCHPEVLETGISQVPVILILLRTAACLPRYALFPNREKIPQRVNLHSFGGSLGMGKFKVTRTTSNRGTFQLRKMAWRDWQTPSPPLCHSSRQNWALGDLKMPCPPALCLSHWHILERSRGKGDIFYKGGYCWTGQQA